jgi:fido (protein-threonine AMPylation protein)
VFTERLTYYLGEINAIHPFREGNGRAQRAFFRQLAGAGVAETGYRKTGRKILETRKN